MSPEYRPLPVSFYERDAERVARDLLGCRLVSERDGRRCSGRIIETEAYPGPHDPASHAAASIGRTDRNDPMFGPPGTAYVHLNYGVHWCLNAVVGREGYPAAVLIRALEPLDGRAAMRERRGRRRDRELCSGPAKLTRALGIGPELQRHRLTEAPLYIAEGRRPGEDEVVCTPRVGISRGLDHEWRFCVEGSRWLSRPPLVARRAALDRDRAET